MLHRSVGSGNRMAFAAQFSYSSSITQADIRMAIPMITKLEAAHRQLTTAIRMFFADGDAVAVHTLACAAREIYERHGGKAGNIPATGSTMSSDTDFSEN